MEFLRQTISNIDWTSTPDYVGIEISEETIKMCEKIIIALKETGMTFAVKSLADSYRMYKSIQDELREGWIIQNGKVYEPFDDLETAEDFEESITVDGVSYGRSENDTIKIIDGKAVTVFSPKFAIDTLELIVHSYGFVCASLVVSGSNETIEVNIDSLVALKSAMSINDTELICLDRAKAIIANNYAGDILAFLRGEFSNLKFSIQQFEDTYYSDWRANPSGDEHCLSIWITLDRSTKEITISLENEQTYQTGNGELEQKISIQEYFLLTNDTDIKTLTLLWQSLQDTPVNKKDCLDEAFLHFDVGTHQEEVWNWFKEVNADFSVAEHMYSLLKNSD